MSVYVSLSVSVCLSVCTYLHVVAVGLPDVLVGVRLLVVVVGERRLARRRHAAEARLVEGLDVALQTPTRVQHTLQHVKRWPSRRAVMEKVSM